MKEIGNSSVKYGGKYEQNILIFGSFDFNDTQYLNLMFLGS